MAPISELMIYYTRIILTVLALFFPLRGVCQLDRFLPKTEFTGDVFVVTKDRQNIKLGLVRVSALSEDQASAAVRSAAERIADMPSYSNASQSELMAALFSLLPRGSASADTDADGKFVLPVTRAGRYVIVATADRELLGRVERYHWAVLASVAKFGSTRVVLSNNNLSAEQSAEPLFLEFQVALSRARQIRAEKRAQVARQAEQLAAREQEARMEERKKTRKQLAEFRASDGDRDGSPPLPVMLSNVDLQIASDLVEFGDITGGSAHLGIPTLYKITLRDGKRFMLRFSHADDQAEFDKQFLLALESWRKRSPNAPR